MLLPRPAQRLFQTHPLISALRLDVQFMTSKLLEEGPYTMIEDVVPTHDTARLEVTVLCAHALLLGLALEDHAPDGATWRLTLDLALSLDQHLNTTAARSLPYLLRQYAQQRGHEPYGAPLLDGEIHQAAAWLLAQAQQRHCPLPDAWQPSGLASMLLVPGTPLDDASWTEVLELLDPARCSPLRGLYDQSETEAGRLSALLLLAIETRGQRPTPALDLLEDAARLSLVHRDIEREQRAAPPTGAELTNWVQRLHLALGKPRIAALRSPQVIPKKEREALSSRARAQLRQLRYELLGRPSVHAQAAEAMLYTVFEHLDAELECGITLATSPMVRTELVVFTIFALTKSHRSPGGHLPVIVELSAQMCGIDPLWAWTLNCASAHSAGGALSEAVHLLCLALQMLLDTELPEWAALETQAHKLIVRFAGHLLAVARGLGLRLPEHQVLVDFFSQFGSLPARTLSDHELVMNHEQLNAVVTTLVRARIERQLSAPVEAAPLDLGPAEPPAPPAVLDFPPVHVTQGTELLEGCHVVLIGGQPSPERRELLQTSLKLASLDWVDAAHYAHGQHAASHIRPQTDLVILAIRWIAHAHNGLRDVARAQGVPCVMHAGGLNPSSVAYGVLAQVSEQLRRRQNLKGVMLKA